MALVIQRLVDDEFETVGRVVEGSVSDRELFEIYPQIVWETRDDDWFEATLNGPVTVVSVLPNDEVEPISNPVEQQRIADNPEQDRAEKDDEDDWVPYVGDEGGTGWTNGDTVRYQKIPPGGADALDQERTQEVIDTIREENERAADAIERKLERYELLEDPDENEQESELEDSLEQRIQFHNQSDFAYGDENRQLAQDLADTVSEGGSPEGVAQIAVNRLEETAGSFDTYSPDDIAGRLATEVYPAETDQQNELARELYLASENPDEYPDVEYQNDALYDTDEPELQSRFEEIVPKGDTLRAGDYSRFGDENQPIEQIVSEGIDAIENGAEPSDVVTAHINAVEQNELSINERGNMGISAGDDVEDLAEGSPEIADELAFEYRKCKRDPENYPRELSDTEESVVRSMERLVEQNDNAYNVTDISFYDMQRGEVVETASEELKDGSDPAEVIKPVRKYVDGDNNRRRFYDNVTDSLTEDAESNYLSTNGTQPQLNQDEFYETLSEDQVQTVRDVTTDWQWEVYTDETAPLFKIAAEQTGNENVPTDDEGVFDVLEDGPDLGSEEYEVIEDFVSHHREKLRETYGETVTCYRGLSPDGNPSATGSSDISRQIEGATEAGDTAELPHRTLESWAVNPLHAELFAGTGGDEPDGIIIENEIPIEKAILSSYGGGLSSNEDEIVAAHDGPAEYGPEDVLTADEVRSGDHIVRHLENAQEFVDDGPQVIEQSTESRTVKDEPAVEIETDDLPPINWLREADIEGGATRPSEQATDAADSGSKETLENVPDDFLKGLTTQQSRKEQIYRDTKALPEDAFEKVTDAFRAQIMPDEVSKSPSWQSDDGVTERLQNWVDAVAELEDPMYDRYANAPAMKGITVKAEIRNSLTQYQGWSLDSIDQRLKEKFPRWTPTQRETVARTEVSAILNRSKIVQARARKDNPIVKWVGPDDSRTTNLCQSVKAEIPDEGLPMDELLEVLKEKARETDGGTPDRVESGLAHFQERHTFEIQD